MWKFPLWELCISGATISTKGDVLENVKELLSDLKVMSKFAHKGRLSVKYSKRPIQGWMDGWMDGNCREADFNCSANMSYATMKKLLEANYIL